jgi:hypothetical protein
VSNNTVDYTINAVGTKSLAPFNVVSVKNHGRYPVREDQLIFPMLLSTDPATWR